MRKSVKEYIPAILHWWWVIVVAVIGDVAGIILTVWQSIKVPFLVWALILLLGLTVAQFLAFHQVRLKRDELLVRPKPVPLRNREALIRAIGAVKEKAITVKMRQDSLNFREKIHVDPQEELYERDDAFSAYVDAIKDLETERLVAGDPFKEIILEFLSFADYHINDCMGHLMFENKPEPLKTVPFMGQLEDYTEWTIRQLDATSSQVPDKEVPHS